MRNVFVACIVLIAGACAPSGSSPIGLGGTTGSAGGGAGASAAGTAGAVGDAGSGSTGTAGIGGASGGSTGTGAGSAGSTGRGGTGGSAGRTGTAGRDGSGGAAAGSTGTAGSAGTSGGSCTAPIGSATTWDQISASHTVPSWLKAAKLGIQIHWGLYAVPAYHNEWYIQHMYCNSSIQAWHKQNFPNVAGYKDFIPLFTASKWDPKAWAALFKKSGATWVQLTAEHHDRFAMWKSALTPYNAYDMGPKRDLVGELGAAVRAEGMKYGVSNHRMYGYSFVYCPLTTASTVGSDLYQKDPATGLYYYGPPNAACGTEAASQSCSPDKAFCDDWLARANEQVDNYQLDVHWFDWDAAIVPGSPCWNDKLAYALHYYQSACKWGKDVAIISKPSVFPGDDSSATGANIMIHDFETGGRAPAKGKEPKNFWMVEDKVGNESWGYINGLTYRSASSIISQIDDYSSRGGVLLLNVSPMADGTIPQAQHDILNAIGKHLGAQ